MVEMVLTRTMGNEQYMLGRLEEFTTGFTCKTMERRDPRHWCGMKNYCAIKEGRYKVKIVTNQDLSFGLRIAQMGAYRNAIIDGEAVPFNMPAGSIAVGVAFKQEIHALIGSDSVRKGLDKWVRHLYANGHISSFDRSGEIMLKVQYGEFYTYKNDAPIKEEKEVANEENFDFIQ